MSRTFRRKDPVGTSRAKEMIHHILYGEYYDEDDLAEVCPDRKNPEKPGKSFKYFRKRARKAKEKQALRTGNEIPMFKKNDVWDYN